MKCDICRRKSAVIFVQQVSRDGSIELHLCEECARERGFTTGESKMDISLGGIFSGITEGSADAGKLISSCPQCGTALSEIRKTGRAGCAECYHAFQAEIIGILRKDGIDFSYTGPLPAIHEAFQNERVAPENMREELRKAIEREDYELAAYYRDRIRALGDKND